MTINILNTTHHPVFGFEHELLFKNRFFIVILKQSWQMMPGGGLRPLKGESARPIRLADVWTGKEEQSAIHLATDLIPYKPHSEVILTGNAHISEVKTQWEVGFSIDGFNKYLTAYGERIWNKELMGWKESKILPNNKVELNYASAFGGCVELINEEDTFDTIGYAKNYGGKGWFEGSYRGELSKSQEKELKNHFSKIKTISAPNLESNKLFSKNYQPGVDFEPCAFGALPIWSEQRMNLLPVASKNNTNPTGYPDNFNTQFWQQAHSDQWLPKNLKGGEFINLKGIFPEGDVGYRIPKSKIFMLLTGQGNSITFESEIDTVIIDASSRILEVVERCLVPIDDLSEELILNFYDRAE
jgi:hypothetical protein